VSLWGNGEKSVDESSGKLGELDTHLYDFPDPISKIGMQGRGRQEVRAARSVVGHSTGNVLELRAYARPDSLRQRPGIGDVRREE
jgi:hypothetical protein